MDTVEFVISDDDLNLVIELLDSDGQRFYQTIRQTLDAERDRRNDGGSPRPIRLDRDRAVDLSQWLAQRARTDAHSADARDEEHATPLARVGIAVESALKTAPSRGGGAR